MTIFQNKIDVILWLFVRFTFCHRTTVTLDTQWQNACTFLECINLRYTTEHDNTLSLRSSRNQGRCKLLPRNSAAAMSSSRHSSEVRRSFRVSTGRRGKSTVEFLQRTVPNFIEPSVWPPISPDLNPVDYAVWGALQQSAYCIPISNLGVHKDKMRTCWESLDQQIINKSIDQWRDRLKAVVRVNGGHIEQLF